MSNNPIIIPSKPKDTKKTLSQLFSYLGKHRIFIFISIGLMLVSTAGSLYGSYAISPIINLIEKTLSGTITNDEMMRSVIILVTGLGIVYFIEIICTYISAKLMLFVSEETTHKLRTDLYHHLVRTEVSYHDRQQHGELMSRFTNDIDVIGMTLQDTLRTFINNILTLVGTLIVMLILSPVLFLVILAITPLLVILVVFVSKKSRRASRQRQKALGALNGYIEETIEGNAINQLFTREELTLEEFNSFSKDFSKKSFRQQALSMLMMPMMQNLNMLIYALVGIAGGYLSINGLLTIGAFSAFVNMTRQFGRPINMISNQYTMINSAISASERVFEVMNQPLEAVHDATKPLENVVGDVVFENVSFGYEKSKPVLKNVSFYAKVNQKIAFVGSTGAGKTTITNLISRFYEIDEGKILIDGQDIQDVDRFSLRKSMAMVLQDTNLFTGTIMENIRYGKLDATDEECIAAAKLANAHHFISNLEYGYETVVSGNGEELSQGQRQLINIARAAVANPKILILDEATSSIDTRTERLVEKGMDSLMEGRTTFVIAHRLSTVRNSEAILVIDNGEIIERGNHDDLLALNGRYASLYKGQSELA
ncbi:MAG: ABC transporter ATP-binding protein [Erysipelothrix sp.]|nr:ABC transporter ATP-binding protein [Erysipelothrix sp.]